MNSCIAKGIGKVKWQPQANYVAPKEPTIATIVEMVVVEFSKGDKIAIVGFRQLPMLRACIVQML